MYDIGSLRKIREEINYIAKDLITDPVFPTDSNKEHYFFAEIDTLLKIANMSEQRLFKESFILLRTVLEKLFYFWLMFEGKRYRHPMFYNIIKETSKTDKDARNLTLDKWKKLWKEGDKRFRDVIAMEPGKNDAIIKVIYEYEGAQIISNGIPTGEMVPLYNGILEQYNPDVAHLGNLNYITGNSLTGRASDKSILIQKTIYHNFFYIDNLLRNLRINKLADKKQIEMIKVHYNFLSKYVHVSMDNLEVWQDVSSSNYNHKKFENEVYHNLIILYVIKLFHLYLSILIRGYNNFSTVTSRRKYQQIVEDLESSSKDLWFFDSEPTGFDIRNYEHIKQIRGHKSDTVPNDFYYYQNPLERMRMLLEYYKTLR